MIKLDFYVEDFKEIESAARLERKSFFCVDSSSIFKRKREQKRLGAEGGNSCPKINFIDIKI